MRKILPLLFLAFGGCAADVGLPTVQIDAASRPDMACRSVGFCGGVTFDPPVCCDALPVETRRKCCPEPGDCGAVRMPSCPGRPASPSRSCVEWFTSGSPKVPGVTTCCDAQCMLWLIP